MSATVLKGIFLDALYQVLDNRVFRVLLWMTLLPILATFLVGVREDGFSLVFGLWTPGYPAAVGLMGPDPRAALVEIFLDTVVTSLVGGMGMTICLAATAFFVPRMLEKGAADLVFVKPIPRWVLYLARYVTGIVFVALLSVALTGGMYLGVLTSSGLSYPAILWSSLTLVYLYALVHGVTMLIGILTRSTPAAMILGIVFFFGNGCVHGSWQLVDQFRHEESLRTALVGVASTDPDEDPEAGEDDPDTWSGILSLGAKALDGLHYVLPKTSDAPLVVLHVQEALLPSGRLETRSELYSGMDKQTTDGTGNESPGQENWFEQHFSFHAEELRYNAWFSLLSSLAFTLGVLGLGMWRLRRMDF